MTQEQKFLDAAIAAVKKTEPIFLKYFGKPEGVKVKEGAAPSLVTDADKEIEKILSKEILAKFPSHAIVGEECAPRRGDSRYTWYIDPIDGTTNFIRGISHCCISVGLFDENGPLVGVVSDPVSKTIYTSVRGGGAFKNEKKLSVSRLSSFNMMVGGLGWRSSKDAPDVLLKKMLTVSRTARVFASVAMELAMVAEGSLDCFAATVGVSLWDAAAGMLLVSEAGGKVSDWSGAPFAKNGQSLAASNGLIQETLLKALKG